MNTWKAIRLRIRCAFLGHRWFTIITSSRGTYVKQRCQRCGHYRTHRLSDRERVKGMT